MDNTGLGINISDAPHCCALVNLLTCACLHTPRNACPLIGDSDPPPNTERN